MWNGVTGQAERAKFGDMSQRIVYVTSHDVEQDSEQRLYPYFLAPLQEEKGSDWGGPAIAGSHPKVAEQIFSAFAIMLTTPGIPMFLAGEEFADLHDIPHYDWRQKMSDPINWGRRNIDAHKEILDIIRPLIQLRVSEPSLRRNEVKFFGLRAAPIGTASIRRSTRTTANGYSHIAAQIMPQWARPDKWSSYAMPGKTNYPAGFLVDWPWGLGTRANEIGGSGQAPLQVMGSPANIVLKPFQTRVFVIR